MTVTQTLTTAIREASPRTLTTAVVGSWYACLTALGVEISAPMLSTVWSLGHALMVYTE